MKKLTALLGIVLLLAGCAPSTKTTFDPRIAATETGIDITVLPDIGTPAAATDSFVTYDSSAASESRITELKFSSVVTDFLNGDGLWVDLDTTTVGWPSSLTVGTPTYIDTLDEMLNHTFSAGVMHDCDITDNLDGTVDIASGYATLRATADSHEPLYIVSIAAQNNISLNQGINYLILDWNSGTPQWIIGASFSDFNCQNKCVAYKVVREGTTLYILDMREQNVDSNTKLRRKELETKGFEHAIGGSAVSASGLNFAFTAGTFWYELNYASHAAFDTSGTDTFKYYYTANSGATWTIETSQTLVENTYYNDITTGLVELANTNKYTVEWAWIINDTPSVIALVHGQTEYDSLGEALADVTLPSVVPPVVEGLGAPVARFIVQKSASTMIAETLLDAILSSGSVSLHNSLGGLNADDYVHLTAANHTDLTDAGDSALHYHTADRGRSNHLGTQAINTITDLYAYEYVPIEWAKDGSVPPALLNDTAFPPYAFRLFDDVVDEDVNFIWFIPPDLSGTTVQYRVYYLITNAAPGPTEGVAFGLAGVSIGNNDLVNASKPAAVVLADTALNASYSDNMITDWSGDVTITGLAAGETAEINFARLATNVSDNFAQDIGVYMIEIRYVQNPAR